MSLPLMISGLLPLMLGVNTPLMLADAQMQGWVKTFAPIVILDSREISPLTSADAQLALQPELQGTCKDGSRRKLVVKDGKFMQRADVQALIKDCPGELALNFGHRIPKAENVAYYSVVAEGLYLKLQYWFYYGWNDTTGLGGGGAVATCGGHEGDWEHLGLRINRSLLEAAKTPEQAWAAIDDIYLAQHAASSHPEYKWFRRSDAGVKFEGSHLMVFPGQGSHATYAQPGTHDLMTIAFMPIADHNDGKGLRMDLAKGRLEPIVSQPWFDFPGRWGAVVHDGCDALEAVSSASNDGSYAPGHGGKEDELQQGDWFNRYRAIAAP